MKWGGPYKVLDVKRVTRAIASRSGKIIFLNQDNMQDPTDQRLRMARYKEEGRRQDADRSD
jgi:hypothetical protein